MVTGPVPVVRCLSLSDREYRRSIRHCSGESVSSRAGGLWLDQSATGPSRTLWRWRRREGLFIGVGPGVWPRGVKIPSCWGGRRDNDHARGPRGVKIPSKRRVREKLIAANPRNSAIL